MPISIVMVYFVFTGNTQFVLDAQFIAKAFD